MSDVIFNIMPHLLDFQEKNSFRTVRSVFENGMEQRRSIYPNPIGSWTFRYELLHVGKPAFRKIVDSIIEFQTARKGSYDNFWLPSWKLESKLVSNAGANSVVLDQNGADCGFTDTQYRHGNFVYITNVLKLHTDLVVVDEIAQIDSIDGNTLTFTENLTYYSDFVIGSYVMKAYKVTFEGDSLERTYLNPYAYNMDVTFKEDIAGYQEVS